MNKKKLISVIAVALLLGSGGVYLIISEGSNSEVVSIPEIPQVQAPTTVPSVEATEPESNEPLTEEEQKKQDEEKAKEEKEKKEKEEQEALNMYNDTPYHSENEAINQYIYTENTIADLEDRLLEHINTVNSNTTSKVESAINNSNSQVTDKLSAIQQALDAAKLKADEALKKAQEALKKAEATKEEEAVTQSNSKIATISDLNIKGTYTGPIVNGVPTDSGTFIRTDNNKNIVWTYTGSFSNGTMDSGELTYSDGTVLKGSFSAGKLNGDSEISTSTFLYKGTVSKGVITGKGSMSFITGEAYAGEFKNGKYDGLGTYTDNSANTIKGNFKLGNLIERVG